MSNRFTEYTFTHDRQSRYGAKARNTGRRGLAGKHMTVATSWYINCIEGFPGLLHGVFVDCPESLNGASDC
jgi:hypothetical protein